MGGKGEEHPILPFYGNEEKSEDGNVKGGKSSESGSTNGSKRQTTHAVCLLHSCGSV